MSLRPIENPIRLTSGAIIRSVQLEMILCVNYVTLWYCIAFLIKCFICETIFKGTISRSE